MSKAALKVLLNIALIAGDALVRGGSLDVGAEKHEGGLEIVVRADGPRIVLDPELRGVLVADRSQEIRYFDAAGQHVRSLGGQGSGPGEFRSVVAVGVHGVRIPPAESERILAFDADVTVRNLTTDGPTVSGRSVSAMSHIRSVLAWIASPKKPTGRQPGSTSLTLRPPSAPVCRSWPACSGCGCRACHRL